MTVRRLLLVALVLGLTGSITELVLLEHYEDTWQLVPIVLTVAALVVLGWYLVQPGHASALVLRVTMALFLVAGLAGIALHMRGAAEFQLEMDPAMGRWPLLVKVMRAKAPPALAPGLMIQLGLLGLTFTFAKEKHP